MTRYEIPKVVRLQTRDLTARLQGGTAVALTPICDPDPVNCPDGGFICGNNILTVEYFVPGSVSTRCTVLVNVAPFSCNIADAITPDDICHGQTVTAFTCVGTVSSCTAVSSVSVDCSNIGGGSDVCTPRA